MDRRDLLETMLNQAMKSNGLLKPPRLFIYCLQTQLSKIKQIMKYDVDLLKSKSIDSNSCSNDYQSDRNFLTIHKISRNY